MFTRTAVRSIRTFSTTPVVRKTTLDSVKETADVVNKKVYAVPCAACFISVLLTVSFSGKGLASAIDKTEYAADKTKEALGMSLLSPFMPLQS